MRRGHHGRQQAFPGRKPTSSEVGMGGRDMGGAERRSVWLIGVGGI